VIRRRIAASVMAMLAVLVASGCSDSANVPGSAGKPGDLTVIRFGVIVSGGGAELPQTLISTGLAAKFGLKVKIVPYATPGQQYTLLRGHAADLVPGNVLDLERQRRAGLSIRAIGGFQRFSSPIVVRSGSSLTSFADLRGHRIGQFGPTTIDWLTIRAAGRLGTGLDLASADLTQASPSLLSSLLMRGKIDATMQFASLAAGPVAEGRERVLTTVPDLLRGAHLDPDSLDVVWDLTDSWRAAHPGAIARLRMAITEAYRRLKSGDATLWAPFTKLVGISSPTAARAFIAEEISNIDPPFTEALLAPTRRLIDAIASVAGMQAVGFSRLPAEDFLFTK
jgi:ABC-type nitrate/sulfonate/bicarbonate transport system substrate-binding protein